jgi:hypothetical protein
MKCLSRVCCGGPLFVDTDSCRDNENLGKSNANHTIQPICKLSSRYLKNPVTPVFARIQPLRCAAVMRKCRHYITSVFGQIQALHNGWIFDKKQTNGPQLNTSHLHDKRIFIRTYPTLRAYSLSEPICAYFRFSQEMWWRCGH